MAEAHAFSPKEFQCWIKAESTAGTSVLASSGMYQLDVDSVSYPSLNVSQTLDVRSGVGRTLKDEDFFQDNTMRITELSLSGTLHNDVGHNLLAKNICNQEGSGDISLASGHTGAVQMYGESVVNAVATLTVVIRSSDHTNQRSLEFPGMVVTNFSINADAGTEGGRYKFSCTLQSGKKPDLNESSTLAGGTAYANTTHCLLSTSSGHKINNTSVIMNNFTATVDHPAVFTGVSTTGYQSIGRGAECSVTIDTQVKYDGNTKSFVNDCDTQTGTTLASKISTGNCFLVVNAAKYGFQSQSALFTNVAYSEGDIMMLDLSMKAVDDGSNALGIFDIA